MGHKGNGFDSDRENQYAANFKNVNEIKLAIKCSDSLFSLYPSCTLNAENVALRKSCVSRAEDCATLLGKSCAQ